MKKLISLFLSMVMFVCVFPSVVSGADYVSYSLTIIDNGNGTVTVNAYAPEGIYSGKLVISNSDNLIYAQGTAVSNYTVNDDYQRNGVSGICVTFARSTAFSENTEIFSATYSVVNGATITSSDVYSNEWNVSNGSEFVANQNNGPVDVTYTYAPKSYVVKFYGMNNELLKEETVINGSSATAPEAPEVEGYDFDGWDKEFNNISSDLIVNAVYKIKTFTVTFQALGDNVEILGDTTATVKYGTKFEDLPFPEYKTNIVPGSGGWVAKWEVTNGECSDAKGVTSDVTVLLYLEHTGPGLPDDDYTFGDVNFDGFIDNTDASIILKYDAGLIDMYDVLRFTGDVNDDLSIDNSDASLILKYDSGLIDSFN